MTLRNSPPSGARGGQRITGRPMPLQVFVTGWGIGYIWTGPPAARRDDFWRTRDDDSWDIANNHGMAKERGGGRWVRPEVRQYSSSPPFPPRAESWKRMWRRVRLPAEGLARRLQGDLGKGVCGYGSILLLGGKLTNGPPAWCGRGRWSEHGDQGADWRSRNHFVSHPRACP